MSDDYVDLDTFILNRREQLLALFGDDPEPVVNEVLLRAQMSDLTCTDDEQAIAWCHMAGARFIQDGRKSSTWMLRNHDDKLRTALIMRAEGRSDADIGRRLGIPTSEVRPFLQQVRAQFRADALPPWLV